MAGADELQSDAGDRGSLTIQLPSALLVPFYFFAADWRAAYYTMFAGVRPLPLLLPKPPAAQTPCRRRRRRR